MKRLWIATGVLVVMFSITLVNAAYLEGLTIQISDKLTQAETAAEEGEWSTAHTLTESAWATWQKRDSYLHMVLRHSDTDQVHIGFREVQEFINCQEGGEYSAANARLIAQIGLLYEAEQLNLKNLF